MSNQEVFSQGGGGLVPDVAMCLNAGGQKRDDGESQTFVVEEPTAFDWQSGGDSRGLDPKPTAQLQRCQVPAVFCDTYNGAVDGDVSATLGASSGGVSATGPKILTATVRRLTPVECERLQGFPDGYTAIPWRGKAPEDCPDGPRYRALGNSMAVPVMRWVGERIKQADQTFIQSGERR